MVFNLIDLQKKGKRRKRTKGEKTHFFPQQKNQKKHTKKQWDSATFAYGAKSGFVSDDCNEYVAKNQQCTAKTQCFTCWPEKVRFRFFLGFEVRQL